MKVWAVWEDDEIGYQMREPRLVAVYDTQSAAAVHAEQEYVDRGDSDYSYYVSEVFVRHG